MPNDSPKKDPFRGLDKLTGNVAPKPKEMSRRQMLTGSIALGLIGVASAGVYQRVQTPYVSSDSLRYLSKFHANTVIAVATVMVGAAGTDAIQSQRWNPAVAVDRLLGNLATDVREMVLQGIVLFEQARLGFASFSAISPDEKVAYLTEWRDATDEVRPAVWAFLRTALGVGYSQQTTTWDLMGFAGPCVPSGNYAGRTPGQSVAFEWDPLVP